MLRELAGVEVEAKQVERVAEAVGAHAVPGHGWHRGPDAQVRIGRSTGQARGRLGQDSRSQALHGLERGVADKEGIPTRDEGSVTYSGAIESAATRDTDEEPSGFAERVLREAGRRGFDRAPRRAVLGDGAASI